MWDLIAPVTTNESTQMDYLEAFDCSGVAGEAMVK